MVDIISKRSGPRREDVPVKKLIDQNRGTIEKIADQISNGAYTANRQARNKPSEPAPQGLIISDLSAPRAADEPEPYVRISPNRRVVVADANTNRQLHHLGEIRRIDGEVRFVLATKANGFFSPLDAEVAAALGAFDQLPLGPDRSQDLLAQEITAALGYA